MPNLEEKIVEWRRQMAVGGIKTPAVLDELEGHLRDEIRAQIVAGASEARAFESAVARIGNPGPIRTEFNKIKNATCLPVKIGSLIWVGAAVLMAILLLRNLSVGTRGLLLNAHIFSLTAGYLAAFVAGGFGVCYVYWRWSGRLSVVREQSLDRAVFWFSHVCAGLIVAGLFLGMLWSRLHRGSYWTGSPREIGPVCVSVWVVALWLIQRFVQLRDRMLLCIGGNVVVAVGWFGAVILAHPGAHIYQVMTYWPLEVFLGIHFVFFAMGFARRFEAVKS